MQTMIEIRGGGAPENKLLVGKKTGFTQKPTDFKRGIISIYPKALSKAFYKSAFTMAEVLITIGIIGIVAAMTIPGLIKNYQERQFKTAYKKVYSEISQAFQEALLNQEFTRTTQFSTAATTEEFNILKSKFKVMLDCGSEDIDRCWKKGDTLCGGACSSGNSADGVDMEDGAPREGLAFCFIDGGGQSWCTYKNSENIFLVDTNGRANPNIFGRDRWFFAFGDINNNRADHFSNYKKVILPDKDILTQDAFCKHPPCYYQSWLLK